MFDSLVVVTCRNARQFRSLIHSRYIKAYTHRTDKTPLAFERNNSRNRQSPLLTRSEISRYDKPA